MLPSAIPLQQAILVSGLATDGTLNMFLCTLVLIAKHFIRGIKRHSVSICEAPPLKEIAITPVFDIVDSKEKPVRKAEVEEIVELLEGSVLLACTSSRAARAQKGEMGRTYVDYFGKFLLELLRPGICLCQCQWSFKRLLKLPLDILVEVSTCRNL